MRSFVGTSFDSLESYSLQDIPTPEPVAGQVRIRIQATALGFVDGLKVQGRYQVKPSLPYVPGSEIAGIVDAIGPDVTGVRIGDKVATWKLGGGLAEQAVVDASSVLIVNEDISPSTTAAMFVDYLTSYYALFECGKLRLGDTVLVLGASSGVGAVAVQMAARAGAHVIAAVSTASKGEIARKLGARSVVNYLEPDWRERLKAVAPGGVVDIVYDGVGGDVFEPAFRSLAKGGRHLVVGFAGGKIPSLPSNLALLKGASLVGVDPAAFQLMEPERARRVQQSLYAMVAAGFLLPPPIIEFPLGRSREALEALLSRDKKGKVVVLPQH
ncbi:MAG: NADPH:quinone oxidoreductase family protein [Burkholderiales bacterium]